MISDGMTHWLHSEFEFVAHLRTHSGPSPATWQYISFLAHKLPELVAPLGGLRRGSDERVELRACARLADLAERRDRPKRTPLELGGALEVLLDGILGHCGALHALLERRGDVVQALRDGRRGNRRESEKHHVADDLHFI